VAVLCWVGVLLEKTRQEEIKGHASRKEKRAVDFKQNKRVQTVIQVEDSVPLLKKVLNEATRRNRLQGNLLPRRRTRTVTDDGGKGVYTKNLICS